MNRIVALLVLAALAAGNTGCSTAHYVVKDADSGVVAIPANSDSWPFHYLQDAKALIRQHVGPDFEIVREYSAVTGNQVSNQERTQRQQLPNKRNPNLPGEVDVTTGTTTSNQVTEWRIEYRRRSGVGPIAGVPPPITPADGILPVRAGRNPMPLQ
jgi:hypothetical protein